MDPVSDIGFAASMVTVVSVITSTVRNLNDLRSRYNEVGPTVSLLIAQLTTLKAALNQVSAVVDLYLEDTMEHHELATDLGTSLDGCRILIMIIDEQVQRVPLDDTQPITSSIRGTLKYLWDETKIERYCELLVHQTNAMNLLLTALQCRSSKEQQELLSREQSRETIRKIVDDTSSLLWIRDSESSMSQSGSITTEDYGTVEAKFDFDSEIMQTRAYKEAMRLSIKQTIQRKLGAKADFPEGPVFDETGSFRILLSSTDVISEKHTEKTEDTVSSMDYATSVKSRGSLSRSSLLSVRVPWLSNGRLRKGAIANESYSHSDDIKVVIFGASKTGKSTLFKQMEFFQNNGYTQEERRSYRETIFGQAVQCMWILLGVVEELEIEWEGDACKLNAYLTAFRRADPMQDGHMNPEICYAIGQLWKDAGVQRAFHIERDQLPDSTQYFLDSISRLGQSDYFVIHQDILRAYTPTTGIYGYCFESRNVTHRVFDCGGTRSERKKWIHVMKHVDLAIFVADISSYDQMLSEDRTANRLHEDIALFESISNNRWMTSTEIFLLFNKIDRFTSKIRTGTPLESTFPDYKGGSDVEAAYTYIKQRFLSMVKTGERTRPVFTHRISALDNEEVLRLVQVVNEELRHLRSDILDAASDGPVSGASVLAENSDRSR